MKKIAICLLAITLFTAAIFAQDKPSLPTVEVTGSAEIFVAPDEVAISLDVTKTNKDLQTAKREADAALSQILALTRKYEIKPENVKTHYISVEMKYNSIRDPKNRIYDEDGDEIGTKVFLGYEISTTVSVRMTDITKFQSFLDEVLKTGLTEVDIVKFESSKLREHKDRARELAMKAAHEKASAMARAISQTIGKAIFIKENKNSDQLLTNANFAANTNIRTVERSVTVSEPMATFSPGAISINAEVSVVFLLN
jgi:uncharacterized protein YggE